MKIDQLVLPGDLYMAVRHMQACSDLLVKAAEKYESGEIHEGDKWLEDFFKSKKELHKMIQSKRMNELVEYLKSVGVNIEIVRKIEGEINA